MSRQTSRFNNIRYKILTLSVTAMMLPSIIGCDTEEQTAAAASQQQQSVNHSWHDTPVTESYQPSFQDAPAVDAPGFLETALGGGGSSSLPSLAGAQDSMNAQIYQEAVNSVGESSKSGPGGGNVACAWFVNKILKRSIGTTVNGDSTSTMGQKFNTLVAAGRAEEIPLSEALPGDIVISPTEWSPTRNTGHVGIVGDSNKIFSNSSKQAAWSQNFTKNTWQGYYGSKKGLEVKAYRMLS
jgi:hypothetical protein